MAYLQHGFYKDIYELEKKQKPDPLCTITELVTKQVYLDLFRYLKFLSSLAITIKAQNA